MVLALSAQDADDGLARVRIKLHDLGLARHEEEGVSSSFTAAGVQFDGHARRLRATDTKARRFHLACRGMESPAPRFAYQVQAFLGHRF